MSIAHFENVVHAAMFLVERMQPGMEIFDYAAQRQLAIGEIARLIADA